MRVYPKGRIRDCCGLFRLYVCGWFLSCSLFCIEVTVSHSAKLFHFWILSCIDFFSVSLFSIAEYSIITFGSSPIKNRSPFSKSYNYVTSFLVSKSNTNNSLCPNSTSNFIAIIFATDSFITFK